MELDRHSPTYVAGERTWSYWRLRWAGEAMAGLLQSSKDRVVYGFSPKEAEAIAVSCMMLADALVAEAKRRESTTHNPEEK